METISVDGGVDVLSWCKDPEEGALVQIKDVARHPKVVGHVALNADGHQGYGMPIGGVCALKDAICPNMVGKDISCGMRASKTSIKVPICDGHNPIESTLLKVKSFIDARVPTGFHTNVRTKNHGFEIDTCFEELSTYSDIFSKTYKKKVEKSIGTLGGGK